MIFKTRSGIKKQFETVHDFGIDNLIVSGCSFTFNNHETSAATWPYYLRDLGGFQTVLDCSMPAAGNSHISDSLIWALEMDRPDPGNSLIIVMWTGADRDDYICPKNNITDFAFEFKYTDNVMSGVSGGLLQEFRGNTVKGFKEYAATKSQESRSVEQYITIAKTHAYLTSLGYKFVFVPFADATLPMRCLHFDIKSHLPDLAKNRLMNMFAQIQDPYSFALRNDLLSDDDFHPSPNGHLKWTKKILLPYLQNTLD